MRRAFNAAAHQTPRLFPKHLLPYFPSLPVDNIRSGFFERAEVEALLQHIADDGIRDFIAERETANALLRADAFSRRSRLRPKAKRDS